MADPAVHSEERGGRTGDLSRPMMWLAVLLLVGLPLHTGFILVGKALSVPGAAIGAFQLWKEAAIGALLVGAALPLLDGRVRIGWDFFLPATAWLLFVAYLLYCAAIERLGEASLYGVRVYVEPVLAGFAIGVALAARQTRRLIPLVLARVGCVIFALALIQAALPFNPFVTRVRMATADAFGQLPAAMTVSVVSQFRAFATFGDPNDLGFFAGIVLLGTFAPVFDGRRNRVIRRLARAGALLTFAVTYSRSAILAALVGCAVLGAAALLFEYPRHREQLARLALAGMALLVAGALVLPRFASEVPQLQHLANTFSGTDPSARGHVASLIEGAQMFRGHLEGFGLGRVGPRAELYRHGAGRVVHVESSFFQVGLETGMVGLVIYLVAVLLTLGAAFTRAGVQGPDGVRERAWGRTICAVLAAQAVAYLFLPTIVSLQTSTLVWAYIGLLAVPPEDRSPDRGLSARRLLPRGLHPSLGA